MKKRTDKPRPPQGISEEASKWWKAIVEEFVFDTPDSVLVLESAMTSFDRMREAQAIIEADGVVITDRFGQKKQHPATLVERDAKMSLMRAMRHLQLDIQPPARPGTGRKR